jgi:hypothetical protein
MITIHQTLTRQRRKTALELRAQLRKIHHCGCSFSHFEGTRPQTSKGLHRTPPD